MQTNYPSIDTISRIKGVDVDKAKQIRFIMKEDNRNILEGLPVYQEYYQRTGKHMYNPHSLDELKMQYFDILIDGYGVESFETINNGWCDYVNLGDTYNTTICYFQNRFIVCSWGDIAERHRSY